MNDTEGPVFKPIKSWEEFQAALEAAVDEIEAREKLKRKVIPLPKRRR